MRRSRLPTKRCRRGNRLLRSTRTRGSRHRRRARAAASYPTRTQGIATPPSSPNSRATPLRARPALRAQ
jgi:hypothetical protein